MGSKEGSELLKEALFAINTKSERVTTSDLFEIKRILESRGYHVIEKTTVFFDETAMTHAFFLSESHFILHTYFPEYSSILCNLFTCKAETPESFHEMALEIAQIFEGEIITFEIVDRI
jgi:S-adenosylmethionine/arginine decarboxylase-like enzyme